MRLVFLFLEAVFFCVPGVRLEDCLAGDLSCLQRFVGHFTPIFRRRVLNTLCGPGSGYVRPDELEDLVQSTFEAVFKKSAAVLRSYDPDRGMSLYNYLGQLASREAGNYLTRRHAAKRGGGAVEVGADPMDGRLTRVPDPSANPEAALASAERGAALEAELLARLSEKGCLMYRLIYVEELEPEILKRKMGISDDALYTWRKRIKKALALVLEEREDAGHG